MSIISDIVLGIGLAFMLRYLPLKGWLKRVGIIVISAAALGLLPMKAAFLGPADGFDTQLMLVDYGVCILVAAAGVLLWDKGAKAVCSLNRDYVRQSIADIEDEEDFMKTKLGKLMTAVCILLVIYMFVSAFCIYKLNTKLNSLYQITQEMKAEEK